MASVLDHVRLPHEDRTAGEPRDRELHDVVLSDVEDVNESVKSYRLNIQDPKGVRFHPGQWLDVHIRGLPMAGGFTLTSTPSQAQPPKPFLELAVQASPDNPPAAYLWQDSSRILGELMKVRVGGRFTWPPFGWSREAVGGIERVVFVAGGVGVNPLMSMVSHMHETDSMPPKVEFLYTTKAPTTGQDNMKAGQILFLDRLTSIADQRPKQFELTVFTTTPYKKIKDPRTLGWYHDRRIEMNDLENVLGRDMELRRKTVIYVCGPRGLTDDFVQWFGSQDGLDPERVLCEKWW